MAGESKGKEEADPEEEKKEKLLHYMDIALLVFGLFILIAGNVNIVMDLLDE